MATLGGRGCGGTARHGDSANVLTLDGMMSCGVDIGMALGRTALQRIVSFFKRFLKCGSKGQELLVRTIGAPPHQV